MHRVKPTKLLLVGVVIWVGVSPAWAGGLYVTEFGDPGMATSTAGAGVLAQDASTAARNAAGIVLLDEPQWMVSALGIFGKSEFDQDAAGTNVPAADGSLPGSDGGDAGGAAAGAGLFYARPVSEKWGWGFSLFSISGAALDYEDQTDFVGRYWAQKIDLLTITVAPVMSYRVNEQFSIGAGVGAIFGRLDMDVAVPSVLVPPAGTEGRAEISDGDDIEVAWSLSALWQVTPRTRLGLLYSSEVDLSFNSDLDLTPPGGSGETISDIDADVEFPLPQTIRLSGSQDIGDRLTVLATVAWEDWSELDNVFISTAAGTGALPRNWDDTWRVALGLRWRTGGPWTYYTGIAYDTDPTSASDRTADMPIDEQIRLSGGVTYERENGHKIGVAVTYLDLGDAEINNGGNRPQIGPIGGAPWTVAGEYDTNRIFFVGLNYSL